MPVAKDSAADKAAEKAERYDDKMTAAEKREYEKETAKEAKATAKAAEKELPKYDEMNVEDKEPINAEGIDDEMREKADALGIASKGADGIDIPRVELEERIARAEAGMAPPDKSAGATYGPASGSKDGVDPSWNIDEGPGSEDDKST